MGRKPDIGRQLSKALRSDAARKIAPFRHASREMTTMYGIGNERPHADIKPIKMKSSGKAGRGKRKKVSPFKAKVEGPK